MAKKNHDKDEDETPEAPAPEPEPKKPEPRDPLKTVGLESGIPNEYLYIDAPSDWNKDRVLHYAGQRHEHTAVDGDGCWIFRAMAH